jgi:hypothetical protein
MAAGVAAGWFRVCRRYEDLPDRPEESRHDPLPDEAMRR